MNRIPESELILNPDGSIYHLNILPEEVGRNIIFVGDPDRVDNVSQYFDRVTVKKQKREFITHTGYIGDEMISVISTGIGTDNIDIVINELDALVNIDLKTRTVKNNLTSLNIIRIGTSGALQEDIPADSYVCSSMAIGLDNLANYYKRNISSDESAMLAAFKSDILTKESTIVPYITSASADLVKIFGADMHKGITITCPGFYGPQGRVLRGQLSFPSLIDDLTGFKSNNIRITNFEMETAGIYAMSELLGHKSVSLNAIVANRISKTFSTQPYEIIDNLIKKVLDKIRNKELK